MGSQPALFRSRSSWQHFIGGYYASVDRFLAEAQAIGVSRRVPAQVARGMRFGDRVVLLRWAGKDEQSGSGKVFAFAEMVIDGVSLAGLGGEVGSQLAAEGRAKFNGSSAGLVVRECGSYYCAGSWETDADLDEILDRAEALARERGVDVFCMVTGHLTVVYQEQVLLSPAPAFHRGFSRIDDQASFEFEGDPGGSLVVIDSYAKAKRP